ncbi:DUF4153 domain-containing protein [Micromonospora sp. NPDC000668]|uniref:DUF4153 domain-containing protein n=1 Tax=Micromonospora sp. NPDC000668 TaxID=3364219 RepID=UPI00368ADF4F
MTSPGSTHVPAGDPRPPVPGRPGQPWFGPGPALPPPTAGRPQPWPAPPVTPRPPSLLERRWPGPSGAARPVVLAALTAAAAIGASTLSVVRPGVGWLVAALAATVALVTASVIRPRTSLRAEIPRQTSSGGSAARATTAPPDAATTTPVTATTPPAPTTAPPTPPGPTATLTPAPTPAAPPTTAESPTASATVTAVPPNTPGPATTSAPSTTAAPPTTAESPTAPATVTTAPPTTSGPTTTAAPPPTTAPPTTSGSVTTAAAAVARPGATGAPGRVAGAVWAAATVALVAVGSVRAAGWLFALCLIAAAVTATLAVTGGRSPFGMLVAATLPPAATVRALPWAARGLRRTRPAGPGVGRLLTSLAVSAGLLTLFGLLFSSADAVFADLVAGLLPDIALGGGVGWLARLLLIGLGLLGGAYLVSRPPNLEGLRAAPTRPAHRLEWTLPLVLLDALFAAFVSVQLTVFFGGAGHVLRTAGLTYAQYARGGFWQLLAVTALTLLVIAIAARRAPRSTRADRLLVRVLLGTLAALSLVVVASALYRMQVYADAYGATRLRLVVATVELWLGLLFVLVGVAVVRMRADWLPRLVIGTAVLALLGLAVVNPDRLIADRNVDRYLETGRLDVGYLSRLSADAVPALDRLPEPMRSCALREIAAELPRDGLWAANLGRERARRELGPTPATASVTDCPDLRRW